MPTPSQQSALPGADDRAADRAGCTDPVGVQRCDDDGIISNWEDSPFNLRRRRLALAGSVNEVVIADEVAAALRELRSLKTDCERLVFGIRAHNDGVLLAATTDDLDDLIGFVAAEANHEPNRRAQRRLDPHSTRSTPRPRFSTADEGH